MKKVLLATTLLTASTVVATAGVDLSGQAGFGLQYTDDVAAGVSKFTPLQYITLTFGGTVEADSGLMLSATTNYKMTNTDGDVTVTDTSPVNDDTFVSISGGFGKLSMGDVDEGDVQGGLADIGYDGIGIDNLAESLDGSVDHNVNYTYANSGISFSFSTVVGGDTVADATSADAVNESYAFGVKYAMDGVMEGTYIGVGYHSFNADSSSVDMADDYGTFSIYGGTNLQGIQVDGMYSQREPELSTAETVSAWGVTASYSTSGTTVSFAYADTDTNVVNEKPIYGLGIAYDLGAGAKIKAGVGKTRTANDITQTATVGDLGVTFSF